ncbi:hypothetical protein B296_00024625 [Ensete ventricosum]|uniref:Uncharacterized protein n=1 Tax=Ensete ventricosum TaxID=4639 RepID=A0A426Z9Y2_ENSVE|nr:hypothetical protein B296_00024625 [Ensete ventricosum]
MATVSPLTGAATRKGSSPAGMIVAATRCKAARGSPTIKATAYKGDRWQEQSPTRVVPAEGNNTCPKGGCAH